MNKESSLNYVGWKMHHVLLLFLSFLSREIQLNNITRILDLFLTSKQNSIISYEIDEFDNTALQQIGSSTYICTSRIVSY
jgi:hypothetical protein